MTILGRVVNMAGNVPGVAPARRVIGGMAERYGNVIESGARNVEAAQLRSLRKSAGDRAVKRYDAALSGLGTNQLDLSANMENEFARNLMSAQRGDDIAAAQRRGDRFRFAGNRLIPMAVGGGAVVGVPLAGGNMMEQRALQDNLAAQGMSPEEAQVVANEIAYGQY